MCLFMRILGIDPGTATTGFGIIEFNNNEYQLLDYGCIKTAPNQSLSTRLKQIAEDLKSLLLMWKPMAVAVEELFFSRKARICLGILK